MDRILKDKLKLASEDTLLIKALKTLFDERMEKERPTETLDSNDIVLGQQYRAYLKGKAIIEKTFTDLSSYVFKKQPEKKKNRAR